MKVLRRERCLKLHYTLEEKQQALGGQGGFDRMRWQGRFLEGLARMGVIVGVDMTGIS